VLETEISMMTLAGSGYSPGGASEDEAVKALIRATTDAFNEHDANGWTRFCMPDS
jgi:hypothetical protein